MTEEELVQNTLLDLVSPETQPTFLVHAYADETCNIEAATLYAEKLYENNMPNTLTVITNFVDGTHLRKQHDRT